MKLPSLFGWVSNIPRWETLAYPIQGAIIRALKAGASVAVGILLALVTQGLLFPPSMSPIVVLVVTMLLQAADKFLRETQIAKDALTPEG